MMDYQSLLSDVKSATGMSNQQLYDTYKASGLSASQALSVGKSISNAYNSASNGGTTVLSPFGGSFLDTIDQISGMVNANSARNAAEAARQRQWAETQQQAQMSFNAAEAAKNRKWQQYMSDTAHQREVADLRAAGLNPVLSAMNGNGANVSSGATASASLPSGASASADTSGAGAIVSLLGHWINSMTQLQSADVSAKTNLAVADKYNAMSQLIAEMNAQVSREGIVAGLTNTAVSARATEAASAISAAAARYGYDISNIINQEKLAQELYIREKYPDNQWRVLNDILQELINDRQSGKSGFSSAVEAAKQFVDKDWIGDLMYAVTGRRYQTGDKKNGSGRSF